jgi:LmbE family N-acetylglucosaminyl deacetylase
MHALGFAGPHDSVRTSPLKVLCLGAHGDDIEIGCGASLFALQGRHNIDLYWAVATSNDQRADEVRKSFQMFAPESDQSVHLRIGSMRENYLPYDAEPTKSFVHALSDWIDPDIIFTHARHDKHQDHRILREFVGNAFRDHVVLEFEIPKFDGDLLPPSVFIEVSEDDLRRKAEVLKTVYPSQQGRYWFDEALFMGLARVRGVEAHSSSGFAEGFHSSKLLIG